MLIIAQIVVKFVVQVWETGENGFRRLWLLSNLCIWLNIKLMDTIIIYSAYTRNVSNEN